MPELTTETLIDVAIMRAGSGFRGMGCPPEGCEFSIGDLDALIEAYWATKGALQPPVKLGHDEKQALVQEDGFPAVGYVGNLRRRGDRMYADLLNVPKAVADVVKAGGYSSVSVEINGDYEVNGQKYPSVLTGLALLGADLPAIDSLGGITALYQSLHLSAEDGARVVLMENDPAIPAVQPEPVTEVTVDEQVVRQALGLDDDGDVVSAINGLKGQVATLTETIKSDAPDKGEAASLKAELQAANQRIIEADAAHNRDTFQLREKVRVMEAEQRVDHAIVQGRVTPANRDYAIKVALAETEDGWNKFVKTLPSVNLKELGSASLELEGYEPTREEMAVAAQMGGGDFDADKARIDLMRAKGAKIPEGK